MILSTSQRLKLPVSVCGEFAGDPIGAMLLVGMGYRHLSMNTRSVAKIKYVLRHIPSGALKKHVEKMQAIALAGEIRKSSEDFLEHYNLAGSSESANRNTFMIDATLWLFGACLVLGSCVGLLAVF
nr:putative PEP-binding protein [Enterovibrio nigricans]